MAASKKKKNNKTSITVISVVAAAVIIAAAIFIFIWARKNAPDDPSETAKIEISDTVTEKATENTNVVTQPDSESGETSGEDTTDDTTEEPDGQTTESDIPVPDTSAVSIEHDRSEASSELPDGHTVTLNVDAPKMVSDSYGENVSKFNALVSTEVEDLKNRYALVLANPEENSGEDMSFTMSFDVFKNDSGIISVLLKDVDYLGGAHEETVYKSINYELNGGNRLTLDDILVAGKDAYVPFIKSFILEKMRAEPDKYFSTADDALDEAFDETQFYITNKGIVVFFQAYDIAPYTEGMPAFELTYADLAELMAY